MKIIPNIFRQRKLDNLNLQHKGKKMIKLKFYLVFNNKTTGTPISLVIYNKDQKSKITTYKNKFRPGHADYTYQ